MTLSIESDGSLPALTLGTTDESRYYQHRTEIPLLSVAVDHATTLITKVTF